MATTYEPIATTTLGSDTASVTFSSISGYTDIIAVCDAWLTGTANLNFRFNSDSATNYSVTLLKGDGSSASSYRETNTTSGRLGQGNSSSRGVYIGNFMNYSNATTYKTSISRDSQASSQVSSWVSCWRSTSAVTSISFVVDGGFSLKSGSTFTLYGIASA